MPNEPILPQRSLSALVAVFTALWSLRSTLTPFPRRWRVCGAGGRYRRRFAA